MGVVPREENVLTHRAFDTSGLGPWISRASSWLSKSEFRRHLSSSDNSAEPPQLEVGTLSIPNAPNSSEQAANNVLSARLLSRGLQSQLPIITGAIFGVVALILLAFLFWLFFRRRKEIQDKERATDLVSRPFPLSAKPGRSRHLHSIHTVLPSPAPVPEGISPRRTRRKVPPPPAVAPPPPPPQHAKQKEGRARRSSISKSIFGLPWHLPPVSEGYGVGLMTREIRDPPRKTNPPPNPHRGKQKQKEGRRRSSISKSLLGLRWHLPPVSEGYGVGLMTREVPDYGQSSSY
ncbi:hypothetical protein B0H19DRAFT_1153021, partial [Mycena capillaripes]